MPIEHSHAEATYRLIEQGDGTFAVEVTIPETQTTRVSGFDTPQKAEAWIERYQANVATGTLKSVRPNYRPPTK